MGGAFPWKNKSEGSTEKKPRKTFSGEASSNPESRPERKRIRTEGKPAFGSTGNRGLTEGGDAGFRPKRDFKKSGERKFGRAFGKERGDGFKPRFSKPREGTEERPRFRKSESGETKPRFERKEGSGFKPRFEKKDGGGDFKPRFSSEGERGEGRPAARFQKDRPEGGRPRFEKVEEKRTSRPGQDDRNDRRFGGERKFGEEKPRNEEYKGRAPRGEGREPRGERKEFNKTSRLGKQAPIQFKQYRRTGKAEEGKAPEYDLKGAERNPRLRSKIAKSEKVEDDLRLNRFISQSGLCSRREADVLISTGQITVNGKVVDQMGYKVKKDDVVKYGKRILNREKLVYVLLNKPKDFLTTTEDPEERKTVMQLVANACKERIYPVGRLDRNTTGLLLLTNDGELSEKLMHPSHNIKKIYQVDLDRPISQGDETKIRDGVTLEDGLAPVDELEVLSLDRKTLGISIHLGRNRIVRRIFESLEYKVEKLDRVMYAGLTKKDLPRGNWRYLTEKEVINLKYFS